MATTRTDSQRRVSSLPPTCPICCDAIREPVVYPCRHEVCRDCFERGLELANFTCPLCRLRVSTWARRHRANPVDETRKRELDEWARSREGDGSWHEGAWSSTEGAWSSTQAPLSVSSPGEIQREYLTELEQVRVERLEEERRGAVEARRLQDEEELRALELAAAVAESEAAARRLVREEEEREEGERRAQEDTDRRLAEALQRAQKKPVIPKRSATPRQPIHLRSTRQLVRRKQLKAAESVLLPISPWERVPMRVPLSRTDRPGNRPH